MKTRRQSGLAAGVITLLLLLAPPSLPGQAPSLTKEGGGSTSDSNAPIKMLARQAYSIQLPPGAGTPPFIWKLSSGSLPQGLSLDRKGRLAGTPSETGEFRCVATVRDSGSPPRELNRELVLRVLAPLAIQWGREARIAGQRIEGSIKVSNQTENPFDLTAVMLAVADNGRATAVGYQHFTLKPGTYDFEIPFGENLPAGSYQLNVDVVGEVAKNNSIYRARLVTPGRLQVAGEP